MKRLGFVVTILLMHSVMMSMEYCEIDKPSLTQLPKDILTKIVACSEEKGSLGRTCKYLKNISRINNYELYACDPIVLTARHSEYAILLARYKGLSVIEDNLRKHGANFGDCEKLLDTATPKFIKAACFGDIASLQQCMTDPATDFSCKNPVSGVTVLASATCWGHADAVAILLQQQSVRETVNMRKKSCLSALMLAAIRGYIAIVEQLYVLSNIDINLHDYNIVTALYWAVQYGQAGVVEVLLKHEKIDVNYREKRGYASLHIAVQKGNMPVIKLLFGDSRVDRNPVSFEGATLLYTAAQEGHVDIIKYLVKEVEKIDVNPLFKKQYTPLYIASHNGHLEAVEFLLSLSGIQVDYAGDANSTPFVVATQNGHVEIAALLHQHGAKNFYKRGLGRGYLS